MSDAFKSFFGSGYKEKEKEKKPLNQTQGYMEAIKGTLKSADKKVELIVIDPAISDISDCGVCIDVMGKVFEGNDKIEMVSGNLVIDGTKVGQLPITSGTWFNVLKGKIIQTENKILTIIS